MQPVRLFFLAWLALAAWSGTIGTAAARVVDLELVLAVDVSRSIDADEFDLQRQGYAAALTNPEVLNAIKGGNIGAIAVTYIEWSGSDQQRTVVDWTLIQDAASAEAFAAKVLSTSRSFAGYTSISGAIDFAMTRFNNEYEGIRQVIDVSGDGSNNSGRPVTQARDAALEGGIVINGLAIINDRPNPIGPEPKLDEYYMQNVVGGPGAFVMVAEDFRSFSKAILGKLIKEIAAVTPGRDDMDVGRPIVLHAGLADVIRGAGRH